MKQQFLFPGYPYPWHPLPTPPLRSSQILLLPSLCLAMCRHQTGKVTQHHWQYSPLCAARAWGRCAVDKCAQEEQGGHSYRVRRVCEGGGVVRL